MRYFKRILALILANVLVGLLAAAALSTPYVLDLYLQEYRAGGYNTVVMGQSSSEVGIDPHLLDNDEDKVYNFCRGGMNLHSMYPLLRLINENDSVKKIYFSLDYSYWVESDYRFEVVGGANGDAAFLLTESLKRMKNPEFILTQLQHQEIWNLLFPYRLNMMSLSSIPYVLKSKLTGVQDSLQTEEEFSQHLMNMVPPLTENYEYSGRGFSRGVGRLHPIPNEFETDIFQQKPGRKKIFDETYVHPRVTRGFDRMVSYCQEQGIELICFMPPMPPQNLWQEDYGELHDYFQALCAEYGLPFYDLNYLKFEYLPRSFEDYVDWGGHVMGDLAERETRIFREILESPNPVDYFEKDYEAVLEGLLRYSRSREK